VRSMAIAGLFMLPALAFTIIAAVEFRRAQLR
jgi:hypothetical protein